MLEVFDDGAGFSDDAAYSRGVAEETEGDVAGGEGLVGRVGAWVGRAAVVEVHWRVWKVEIE